MITLALAPPSIAVVSFDHRCTTPTPHVATGRPGPSLHRSPSEQAFNAPRQQTASVEIPIASDARPRHTSRGFLRASSRGPASANLHNSGPRTCQVEVSFPWFGPVCSPFMVIVAHRAGVRRPAACRCTPATLPGKAHDLPVCAIARPFPCPNNQRRPHAWLCNPVPMLPLEAGMMNPRRLSTVPAPLLRSVILATGVVGLLAAFGPAGIQNTGAAPRKDISAPSLSTEQELAGAPQPSSMLNDDLGQTDVAMAELSLAGAVADASIALNKPEPVVETASTNSLDVPPTEPAPVQVAMANPSDLEPGDAGKAVSSIEIVDECLVVDICVDRYLWALYQRTPKEDTIKELERRNVAVKRKGKMVTVARTFTKLVDEDFGWKDPKAAERAGMSMMDYVIGGIDRSFKLKLFHTLHAAEAAGLSPGITSAFRDDYRQPIASGLKAASNRSYHGGGC